MYFIQESSYKGQAHYKQSNHSSILSEPQGRGKNLASHPAVDGFTASISVNYEMLKDR